MKNLRVGISGGWDPGQMVEGWPLVYTCKSIVEKVEHAGAVPLVLPIVENREIVDNLLEGLDLLILAGEVLSIKHNVFEEHEKNVLRASNPLRYDNEAALIEASMRRKLPMLGICRGFQVMAAELGGNVQDEDVNENNFIVHQQGKLPPSKAVHSVQILENTILKELLQVDHVMVNSFHRQAVRKVPPGFCVSAISDDGVVEAMESESGFIVLGLQFHPEINPAPIWEVFFRNFFQKILSGKDKRR